MASYDLSHLTQPEDQAVMGPIQDDEALFLYSIIRGMRLKRILEIGGGYSTKNFHQALRGEGMLYTADVEPMPVLGPNHKVILKNVLFIYPEDVDNAPLDLVFFDCHDYKFQMAMFIRLRDHGCITDDTIIALHDTNLHPQKFLKDAYPIDEGFVHVVMERQMTNDFKDMGYDVFSLHTNKLAHNPSFPFRHGVSICRKFKYLKV